MLTTAPRGTHDILPGEIEKWQRVEGLIRRICREYGYAEIRTPVFEHTELFHRTVGETTDIVEKQMYTFLDRGKRSITLRPEGTAPAVRSYLENRLYAGPQPTKLYYIGPMFRFERPQGGRYRQFHQFGIEVLGAPGPAIDAEVIALVMDFYERLGLTGLELRINSLGCPRCRPVYRERLREYFEPLLGDLCEDCQTRYDKNPMRILDCKVEGCRTAAARAPVVLDSLCDECRSHFQGLQDYLTEMGISYVIDPHIVRGLDYYTKTVFEVLAPNLGALTAISGGGRYDGLVEELGGEPTPAIGFGLGLERLLLALDQQGIDLSEKSGPDLYIAPVGEGAARIAMKLLAKIRRNGFSAETDYLGRSLKAQMKYADKLGAQYVLVIGEDELQSGRANLREMASGQLIPVELDRLPEEFLTVII